MTSSVSPRAGFVIRELRSALVHLPPVSYFFNLLGTQALATQRFPLLSKADPLMRMLEFGEPSG